MAAVHELPEDRDLFHQAHTSSSERPVPGNAGAMVAVGVQSDNPDPLNYPDRAIDQNSGVEIRRELKTERVFLRSNFYLRRGSLL